MVTRSYRAGSSVRAPFSGKGAGGYGSRGVKAHRAVRRQPVPGRHRVSEDTDTLGSIVDALNIGWQCAPPKHTNKQANKHGLWNQETRLLSLGLATC